MAAKVKAQLKPKEAKAKFWDDIWEMPIKIFGRIYDDGNVMLVVRSGKSTREKAVEAWEKINEQIIDEFGVSKEYKMYLNKKAELVYWMAEELKSENLRTHARTRIEIVKRELENFFKDENVKFGVLMSNLKKFMAQRIDPETTVYEFYCDMKLMNESLTSSKK